MTDEVLDSLIFHTEHLLADLQEIKRKQAQAPATEQAKPTATAINTLKDGDKKVSVTAKVAGVETPRKTAEHIVQDVTIQDGSGMIKLVLWDDDVGKAIAGSTVKVENGYVSSYKGTLQLNVGKFGKLTVTQQ